MEYTQMITLKNGVSCCLRNGTEQDAQAVLDNFLLTHAQTDYLLAYPDETQPSLLMETQFLKHKQESKNEIELVAVVDGAIVGMAGIDAIGSKAKLRHRAELGISIDRAFWGLGIGGALTAACIACARTAGYKQLELTVVAENARAIAMYEKAGFVEFGRNPMGFLSRNTGFQELVHMRLEL